MRFIDRSFGVAVAAFVLGAFTGFLTVAFQPVFRDFVLAIIQVRMLGPVRTASAFGSLVVFLLIFLNNAIPLILSFGYAFVLAKVDWTPPMDRKRRTFFMFSYTLIASFLIGFFALGATLAAVWAAGGASAVLSLLWDARVHGPLEFAFVLLCVAEPLRTEWAIYKLGSDSLRRLRSDFALLIGCLLGLLAVAAIEAFVGI